MLLSYSTQISKLKPILPNLVIYAIMTPHILYSVHCSLSNARVMWFIKVEILAPFTYFCGCYSKFQKATNNRLCETYSLLTAFDSIYIWRMRYYGNTQRRRNTVRLWQPRKSLVAVERYDVGYPRNVVGNLCVHPGRIRQPALISPTCDTPYDERRQGISRVTLACQRTTAISLTSVGIALNHGKKYYT